MAIVDDRMEQLDLDSDNQSQAQRTENTSEARQRPEDERKALAVSFELLKDLLSKSQAEALAKTAQSQGPTNTVTFGNQNSGIQAGTINGGLSGISFGKQ